jgi:hypothetical protein
VSKERNMGLTKERTKSMCSLTAVVIKAGYRNYYGKTLKACNTYGSRASANYYQSWVFTGAPHYYTISKTAWAVEAATH